MSSGSIQRGTGNPRDGDQATQGCRSIRKPQVFIGQDGGTIASTPKGEGQGNKEVNESLAELISRNTPDVLDYADLVIPEPGKKDCVKYLIDSSEADLERFVECAKIHFSKLGEPFVGHVHTTGTDRLQDKAAAFAIAIRKPPVPIVITAAMRGFKERHSDAPRNLRDAVYAAAHPDMPPGVYVVFNGRIIEASIVQKRSTVSLDAFHSQNGDDVGYVDAPNCLEIRRHAYHRWINGKPELVAEFDPNVKVVEINASYDPAWLEDDLSRCDVHGIILRVPGLGGIQSRLVETLKRYSNKKPIVVQTQCVDGPTNLEEYAAVAGAARTDVLCTGSLSHAYATLLLHHLLAVTKSMEELRVAWNTLVHYRLGASVPCLSNIRAARGPSLSTDLESHSAAVA